jgi:hypothetical protein
MDAPPQAPDIDVDLDQARRGEAMPRAAEEDRADAGLGGA